mmetsp:Transcript_29859/g.68820  ORF Transcript_29859/g.68820 Transcript_29859/m.68820 type:complete len:205 (-) Transcript_29859:149-763(-)
MRQEATSSSRRQEPRLVLAPYLGERSPVSPVPLVSLRPPLALPVLGPLQLHSEVSHWPLSPGVLWHPREALLWDRLHHHPNHNSDKIPARDRCYYAHRSCCSRHRWPRHQEARSGPCRLPRRFWRQVAPPRRGHRCRCCAAGGLTSPRTARGGGAAFSCHRYWQRQATPRGGAPPGAVRLRLGAWILCLSLHCLRSAAAQARGL